MGENAVSKGTRRGAWIAAIAVAFLLAFLLVNRVREPGEAGDKPGPFAPEAAPGADSPAGPRRSNTGLPPSGAAPGGGGSGADPASSAEIEPSGAAEVTYPVNLGALRARLPDNLYWQLGEPTKDPEILQKRAEEEQHWNELFGKVQSNTASEEEIRLYYEHRRRVSEDYVEFSSLVLKEYGDELPDRDRGLYELSVKMHRSRLEELPRQIDDALTRKKAHDQRREEWRRDAASD